MFRVPLLFCCTLFYVLPAVDLPQADIARIQKELQDPLVAKRLSAVESLSGMTGQNTLSVLGQALGNERFVVRNAAIEQIVKQERRLVQPVLQRLAGDRDPRIKASAIEASARILGDEALLVLQKLSTETDPQVAAAVARSLGRFTYKDDKDPTSRRTLEILSGLLNHPNVLVRIDAIDALGAKAGSQAAANALSMIACKDRSEEVVLQAAERLKGRSIHGAQCWGQQIVAQVSYQRIAACLAMGEIGDESVDPLLIKALNDTHWEVAAAAAEALGQIATTGERAAKHETALLTVLGHAHWGVRTSVGYALAKLGSKKGCEGLVKLTEVPNKHPIETTAILRILQRWHHDLTMTDPAKARAWWASKAADWQPPRLAPEPAMSKFEYYELTDSTENAVFVIDVSGSMNDNGKLSRAANQLITSVQSLNFPTRLQLVTFSVGVSTWREGPVRASWRNKVKLTETAESMTPNGGTNIHGALMQALGQWGSDAIYFLTDGMPTVGTVQLPEAIITAVTAINQDLAKPRRIHSFAFQVQEAQAFLQKLAAQNGGKYFFVQ